MPHQCTKCGKVYPDAANELLKGCSCNSRFFYYIRKEKFNELKVEMQKVMTELEKADKDQIEKDIVSTLRCLSSGQNGTIIEGLSDTQIWFQRSNTIPSLSHLLIEDTGIKKLQDILNPIA